MQAKFSFLGRFFSQTRAQGKDTRERIPYLSEITRLLEEVAKTLQNIDFMETWDKETFALFGLDLIYLEQVRALLDQYIEDDARGDTSSLELEKELKVKVEPLLTERWKNVYNTPFCRTLNPHSLINNHYNSLAKILFGDESNKKLMPTLPEEDFITGIELKDIRDGEIVLVSYGERGDQFIHIPSVLDTAIARFKEAEHECLLLYDHTLNKTRNLSNEEVRKIILVHPLLKDFFGLLDKNDRTTNFSIRHQLQLLRNGLKKGDVRHQGTEYLAGSPASDAVRVFHEFFDRLPLEQQLAIRELRGAGPYDEKFGTIFDNLTNPKFVKKKVLDEHGQEKEVWEPDVTTCVEIRGDYVGNILDNPACSQILEVNVEVQTSLSKLKEIKARYDLKLDAHQKAADENEQIVDENNALHQGKLLRPNWTRYIDKLLSVQNLGYNPEQEEEPFLLLRKFVFLMEKYFPNRISQRQKWANVFIMLNRVALKLATVTEEFRLYYLRECYERMRMLAHDFRFFDNGTDFQKELDKLFAHILESDVSGIWFKLPENYRDQLQNQYANPTRIEELKEARIRMSIANVLFLKPDQKVYISVNGRSKCEKQGSLVCLPMSYLKLTNEWVYWVKRTKYSQNSKGFKYWIGPSVVEKETVTCADMDSYLMGTDANACQQNLKTARNITLKELRDPREALKPGIVR